MRSAELYSPEDAKHYGTPRHSGRYPWGSGENPYQHSSYFMNEVAKKRKEGYTDTQIAEMMNMSTTEFRSKITRTKEQITAERRRQAKKMKEEGYSDQYIGDTLGVSEGTVRNLLKAEKTKSGKMTTAAMSLYLKDQVDAKGIIDVGKGVELELGISEVALKATLDKLEEEGYSVIPNIRVEQMSNPGKYTTVKVLATPGTTKSDIYNRLDDIQTITPYDEYAKVNIEEHPGFERTKYGMYKPTSIDSSRIQIRYGDDPNQPGKAMDGVIELRRGVEDISLGSANYAQVRIAVDGTHFLKGMAIYSDDMPDGVDVIFNTNKPMGTAPQDVFKEFKKDPDNPFGAAIKSVEKGGQRFYTDEDGNEKLSAINIVNQQGDWGDWSKTLSSQFLSKQNQPLVKKQLDLSFQNKMDEYSDILLVENPVVKQKLLESFSDDCDASAVHLKAASLPGQASRVILPVPDLPDGEIYAPGYKNGDTVILIRYPHAGTFEIPELKVNNNFAHAKELYGDATDAVGINSKAAQQLSGADFDGDTVMIIPVSKGGVGTKIVATLPLKELENFDTNDYAVSKESSLYLVDKAHGFHKQTEMGKISNLITDMTLYGASEDEIARAVKHSMVVIDAEKHHLDWRQSYIDNGIAELKTRYQGGKNKGASTLISKASSDYRINKRKVMYTDPNNSNVKSGIDITTGKRVYKDTGETYHKPIYEYQVDPTTGKKTNEPVVIFDEKTGTYKKKILGYETKETPRQQLSTKMAETDDAMTLVSPAHTQIELEYASYANKLKDLANTARKEMMATTPIPYDREARIKYQAEVDSLDRKLTQSLMNAPRERQAQIAANTIYKIKAQDNPNMSNDEQKKIKSQTLAEQRVKYGAKRTQVEITDSEWEAIQAGAISTQKLKDIMDHTDMDKLKERAMPRDTKVQLTDAKQARINAMKTNGYDLTEIADAVGLSSSTIAKYLDGKL